MKYLEIEFKNYKELENWNKAIHIREYKKLAEMFNNSPSMEISSMMSDRADILHTTFGMSWEEIEELEIA